jgi:uncharacterized glyoxalase superfamily protein PhnB
MTRLHADSHSEGNAEEAFNFYTSVFGGEFSSLVRRGDLPATSCRGSITTTGNDFDAVA